MSAMERTNSLSTVKNVMTNSLEMHDADRSNVESATRKYMILDGEILAAARDLKLLESELGNATPQPIQLLTHISSARAELGLGKLEAAQDLISGALFLTEQGGRGKDRN
jgi:hypothetical protein